MTLPLVKVGLSIYILVATFIYIDILEVYKKYTTSSWHAIGLAVGLDAMVIYFNVLAVLKPIVLLKTASYLSTLFVWFVVFLSLSKIHEETIVREAEHYLFTFLLSLFVLFTAFLGRALGKLLEEERESSEETLTSNAIIDDSKVDCIAPISNTKIINVNIDRRSLTQDDLNKIYSLKSYEDCDNVLILPYYYYNIIRGDKSDKKFIYAHYCKTDVIGIEALHGDRILIFLKKNKINSLSPSSSHTI